MMRQKDRPWETLGMTWYRAGKPTAKPFARPTQQALAAAFGVSVRSIRRAARIQRLAPDLADKCAAGALTLHDAEGIIIFRGMLREGREREAAASSP